MGFVSVYITTKDVKEARVLARALVRERLAACVNIMPCIESVYWWKGKIVQESEAALVCKTTEKKFARLVARVKELHSYTVPCITAWPITKANKEYLRWLAKETA